MTTSHPSAPMLPAKPSMRLQGMIFCAIALAVTAATLVLPRLSERAELIVIAVLIVILGVPHGALDTIFAKLLYQLSSVRDWAVFAVTYVLLAAAIVGLWLLSPLLFLLGFLVISIWHFSGDPAAGTPLWMRLLYGGAVIVLPTLTYPAELERLFGFLIGQPGAAALGSWLSWLAWPWLGGLTLAVYMKTQTAWLTALEIAVVGLIAIVAPPLTAFAVYFCAMHSARHFLRTFDYAKGVPVGVVLAISLGPLAGVAVMGLAAWLALGDRPLDARIIQIVFVGLAALTVPHMALVERVRLTGWE